MPYISYMDKGIQKYFKLLEDRMSVFGREEHVDFQISNDSLVSREHFSIEKDERGRYVIIELGASNGTYLNGSRLESNSIIPLRNGDKIVAGKQEFYFRDTIVKQDVAKNAMNDVLSQMKAGKGFETIMSEILGKPKSSASKPNKDAPTVRPKS
jgi:pSer/pThr/pTyr-binding forkhead associated (FHA) protein